MKIVLAWNGPANAAERGVMARRQVPLLRHLAVQGVHATVVLLGDRGGVRADLENAEIDTKVLPTPLPPAPTALGHMGRAVLRLRPLIRRLQPDVLEGDEPMPAIAAGLAARTGHRCVVMYRRHHHGGRARLLVASRLAARLADRTVVSCEAMRKRAAADDGTDLERIEVASSGAVDPGAIPAHTRSETRRSLGIDDRARVIGVVSRLRRQKGLDILLVALNHLDTIENVHLVIVGTGPEDKALRVLAAHCPVRVHFLGHRDDVTPWFAIADVIVMPSRGESFGRATLETMAAGRPLVATRVGGLAEAVADKETGLLVPPDDPHALAMALNTVLGDEALACRMGRAARARYESRYTIEHMATAWRRAWERALAGVDHLRS